MKQLELPTPREVLAIPGYRPHEHLLRPNNYKKSIARVPEHPDILLRWYPYNPSSRRHAGTLFPGAITDRAVAQRLLTEQSKQMGLLRDAGITVVRHCAEVAEIRTPDWRGTAWVATVEKLPGHVGSYRDKAAGQAIVHSLMKYYGRIADGELCMYEVNFPAQYATVQAGEIVTESDDAMTTATLLDIDPELKEKYESGHDHYTSTWQHNLDQQ